MPHQPYLDQLTALLWEHPLADFRAGNTLRVTLVGSGARLNTALDTVLTQGQLPHVSLTVTVVTGAPHFAAKALLDRAPDLERFVRVTQAGQEVCPAPEIGKMAEIHYVRAPIPAPAAPGVWVLAREDGENAALAARLAPTLPSGSLLAGWGIGEISLPGVTVMDLNGQETNQPALKNILFNIQQIYSRMGNPRAAAAQVWAELEEEYNYSANLSAALHLKEKLLSINLRLEDPSSAERLVKYMSNAAVVDALAVAEHRRWMMDQLLKGVTQPDEEQFESLFYSAPGVTTHGKGWHCCLVPSRTDSALTADDWSSPQPRPELDELDRMSLRVRAALKGILDKNQEVIELRFRLLSLLDQQSGSHALPLLNRLEEAAIRMRQGSTLAVTGFDSALRQLREMPVENRNDLLAQEFERLLPLLNCLREYCVRKDYKALDREFVRCLPYVITHKPQPKLAKLVSDGKGSIFPDVYSAWLLEPGELLYLAYVRSDEDMKRLEEIDRYYRSSSQRLRFEVLLAPEAAAVAKWISLPHLNCRLLTEEQPLNRLAAEVLDGFAPDYIDTTEAPIALRRAAIRASEAPAFETAPDGQLRVETPELNYPGPERAITVMESLTLAGNLTRGTNTDASRGLTLEECIRLWKLRNDFRTEWSSLCGGKRYRPIRHEIAGGLKITEMTETRSFPVGYLPTITAILNALRQEELVESYRVDGLRRHGFQKVTVTLRRGKVSSLMNQLSAACQGGELFVSAFRNDESNLASVGGFFTVANRHTVPLSPGMLSLLREMYQGGFLSALDETAGAFSFRGVDLFNLFGMEGNLLEVSVMAAAMEANLYSVENSVEFITEGNSRPVAELDVVATSGLKTLFLSCKDWFELDYTRLSAACDEIKLHARTYGLNGVPVLVCTGVDTLSGGELSSFSASQLREGCYLIGKDLLPRLPAVLRAIADGKADWYR